MNKLLINKRIMEVTHKNPNQTIANLSQVNNEEISLLKFQLKNGLLFKTKESEMIIIMEDIYD